MKVCVCGYVNWLKRGVAMGVAYNTKVKNFETG